MRVGVIQIVGGQQPMALGTDVGHLNEESGGHLALKIEVILIGILRAKIGLKLAVELDGPKLGEIHGLSPRGIQYPIERVGAYCSVLAHERRIEHVVGKAGASPEGRLAVELFQNQLLDGVVKHPPAHANAGFIRTTGKDLPPSRLFHPGLHAKPNRGANDL